MRIRAALIYQIQYGEKGTLRIVSLFLKHIEETINKTKKNCN